MADGALHTKLQRVSSSTTAQNKKNPSKFCCSFFFKALIITIFLGTIPLFHSDSPAFASSSIYTRGWELLHLILVGIAVSYGLFSRRNDDHLEGENNSKTDAAQSYMSRLLQFPSLFDDEGDTPSESDDHSSKFQTWSSRYQRHEPLLVVAEKGNASVEKSGVDEKPLLLPVRSLKSRISDENDVDLVDSGGSRVFAKSHSMPISKEFSNDSKRISRVDDGFENSRGSRVYARSNTSPTRKGVSNESRSVRNNGSLKSRHVVADEFGYGNENGGVSRSLSRSNSNTRGSLINSSKGLSRIYGDIENMDDKDGGDVVLPSPIPWQSRSGRFEMKRESNASMEEIKPNQSFKYQSPRSSVSDSSYSSPTNLPQSPSVSLTKKLSPSSTLSLESQARSAEDVGRRKVVYSSHLPPPPPPPPPPPRPIPRSRGDKSGPTLDNKEISTHYADSAQSVCRASNATSGFFKEAKARNDVESSSVVESSKAAVSADKIIAGVNQTREIEEESGRKSTTGYDPMSRPLFSGLPKETRDFLEQVFVETDDDSESEGNGNCEESEERVENKEVKEEGPPKNVTDEGPDVDKKADEFIAKFREQIRLQRIEEIKRSARQLKRSSEHNPE